MRTINLLVGYVLISLAAGTAALGIFTAAPLVAGVTALYFLVRWLLICGLLALEHARDEFRGR